MYKYYLLYFLPISLTRVISTVMRIYVIQQCSKGQGYSSGGKVLAGIQETLGSIQSPHELLPVYNPRAWEVEAGR